MKTVTNNFKEQIAKLGREIDFKIFLHTNDKIITEDGKFLMTEDNAHLVVEQFDEEEIDEVITGNDIFNVAIVNKGKILSTMMKEVDFEVRQDLRVGDVIDCQFGLKVDSDYEYVNYGRYMIYSKEFNEDTKTYNYVAFDKMLLTMQEIPDTVEFLGETLPMSQIIKKICSIVGLNSSEIPDTLSSPYHNITKYVNAHTFEDLKMTYRDMLDQMCQAIGVSMIVENNKLKLKALDDTIVDTFDEKYLKDTNVSFGEKYGPINSVSIIDEDGIIIANLRDEESITLNGLNEYKIKNNLIMSYNNEENYIDDIFRLLKGTEFYINDFSSTGITYLDWLDSYNVKIGNKIYKCLMLNNEIKIQQGLEEKIYTEMPEQAGTEITTIYKTSGKTNKEVSFTLDKQKGQIKGTVQQDNIIADLNLAIEDGKGVVELKGNSVIIESDNFTLDENGKAVMSSAEINHGSLKLYDESSEGSGIWPEFSIESGDGSNYNDSIVKIWSNFIQFLSKYDSDVSVTIGLNRSAPTFALITKTTTVSITPGEIDIKRTDNDGAVLSITQILPGSITLRDSNGNRKTITPTN